MSVKPYYTSATLIEAVKRNMSIPISQITFSDADILAFATEELVLSQLPSILQYHEEYYVYTQSVPLVSRKSRYPIPSRAIGMKLRDLFYVDNQGQLIEMSKVNPDDTSWFQSSSNANPTPIYYYVENNSIVILPEITDNPQGTLLFKYYLRPNSLVPDNRAAISTGFSKSITVDNAQLQAGDFIKVGTLQLVAGTDFAIGVNSSITSLNLTTALNSNGFSALNEGALTTVTYSDRMLEVSSASPGLSVQQTITIVCSSVPTDFAAGQLVDILQQDGGHSTLNIDVLLGTGSVSTTGLTFPESAIPNDFVVGDYICQRYECIVPQIPTDLHVLLGERTGSRVLESLGDQVGLQRADKKIADLEARQSVILDSRVEGSPTKIFNKNSLLRKGKLRSGRGSI